MRKNNVLNYLISDHLGSTSLVTDANGAVINQTKYKAWGETRYSSGTEQTKYTYTGQYSYVSDFGLHFYNARWYDSSLGRFAQADTIVPGNQGVQAYDRYTYTSNNPLRYTDPSGHCAIDADADECFRPGFNNPPSLAQQLGQYGITTTNATSAQNQSTLQAAQLAGNKLAETIGGGISAQDAFRQAQGNISITCGNTEPSWLVQTIIHEFGHVFDNQFQDLVDGEFFASSYPINGWDATVEGYKPGYDNGFPSMQHPFPRTGARGRDEDFADMYLNWVLDMNPAFPDNGFTTDDWGNDRRDMMNNTVDDPTRRGMAVWLQMMGLR